MGPSRSRVARELCPLAVALPEVASMMEAVTVMARSVHMMVNPVSHLPARAGMEFLKKS